MRYAHGVTITLLTKGMMLPIGIITSIITARTLGPEGRGVLALMIFFQGLTLQFGTLGMNASITYFMSREPDSSQKIVSNAVSLAVVGGILIALILWGLALVFPASILGSVSSSYLEILLLSVPFTFLSQFLQNVFLARQRIVDFNLLDLGIRFTQMSAFGIVLWWLGGNTTDAVWIFSGVAIAGGIAYLLRTRTIQPFRIGFDLELFRRMFAYGGRVYVASILMFLVSRVHMMVLNLVRGEADAGVYSVALQLMDILYLVPVSLGLILFPKVSAGADPEGQLTKRVIRTTLVGMTLLCGTLALVSEPLVRMLFGEKFIDAAAALQVLAPGIVSLSLIAIINNDLTGRGLPPIVVMAPFVVLLLTVPPMYFLLPVYGIMAAALTATIGDLILLAILMVYYKNHFAASWKELFILRRADLKIRFLWGG